MKPLLKTTVELRAVVSFNGDIAFSRLQPGLLAAQTILLRYVGGDLLEQLTADEIAPDSELSELLGYAKIVVGNLALVQVLGTGNVTLSDIGVMRAKTAEQSDAFEWQIERAAAAYQAVAYDGLEALLGFLAANLEAFPAYRDSQAYKRLQQQLVPSAELFNGFYEIGCSRLIYQTLSASMRSVEERTIRPLLGSKLAGLLGDALTEKQVQQLTAARRALVYGTLARALRERLISLTELGVKVTVLDLIRRQNPPTDKQLAINQSYLDTEFAELQAELVASLAEPVAPGASVPTVSPIINKAIVRL